MVLNDTQKNLAAEHTYIVEWAIYHHIQVNEKHYGLGYDDLYQEGCMWLCRAAAEYDRNQAQFETYAQVVVKNGLLSYCKKIYNEQKNVITMSEICSYSDDNIKDIADCAANNVYDEFVFDYVVSDLFETVKFEYKGVTRLGIEALELKFKGYTGVEIAQLWGVEQNHIGAWISRAKKKLRQNKKFISAFQA